MDEFRQCFISLLMVSENYKFISWSHPNCNMHSKVSFQSNNLWGRGTRGGLEGSDPPRIWKCLSFKTIFRSFSNTAKKYFESAKLTFFVFHFDFFWRPTRHVARVCVDMHGCAHVCGMNFQNFFWRIESLHQRTLIRILYEFFLLDFSQNIVRYARYV